ncbi:MAG TPA: chemotaxis protein CheB [Blastocatellia bacterium]|nr:chemotaxis protein CheB [Blastocatellia bacterium]
MEKKKRESRKQPTINEDLAEMKKPGGFILVGIGASAGGFKPIMELLRRLPADSGMAYVVILHLSPTHKSSLDEVLQNETAMPVTQVQDAVKVEKNHVYVIPPNKNLLLEDGVIRLREPDHARGDRVPIDLFFRSLGEVYRNNAIAILLSGAGADGMLGMQRVKEKGGLTIVQDPREAVQASMPNSAIHAGVVDFVLPVAEIPDKLMSLWQNAQRIVLPPADAAAPRDKADEALRDVLTLVRSRTGHDFTNYKRSTILRRIERRLQVNGVSDLPAYRQFIYERPDEVLALLRDLLISVTNFFRDHKAFECLAADVIPSLFDGKNSSQQVRVWVTGCATGEEAYSMAILLHEHAARLTDAPKLQVFATDIDEEAIQRARYGLYPETITNDVSPERLKRFFTREDRHYQIRKEVRETVLFAPHNILRDPPFSKLDLITCRNLLIYLTRDIQDRVLDIFHFALRDEGFLFLGSSETAEGRAGLFTPFNKRFRIYRQRHQNGEMPGLPLMPQAGRWEARPHRRAVAGAARGQSIADLHQEWLMTHHAPASALITDDLDIVHLSGNAGRYLQFTAGEPSRNLQKAINEALRFELRGLLMTTRQSGAPVESRFVRAQIAGETVLVKLMIEPVSVPDSAQTFLMVVFNELKETTQDGSPLLPADAAATSAEPAMEPLLRNLEDELNRTREQLRVTVEQYETSNEELKGSNEELQALNEELRSATEELETSKEELQSVNEELTTVNHEYREKLEVISRTNSDLKNLMASTEIGTIFLDRALNIKRYTPGAQHVFNIIASDLMRPLAHITHKLDYDKLDEDAEHVMATLQTVEREVASADEHYYIARLVPYRTPEDRIDGVVLTFIDITDRKRAEQERERLLAELDRQRGFMEAIVRQMPVGIIIAEAPLGRLILGNEEGERIWRHAFIASDAVADYGDYKGFYAGGHPYKPEGWPLARSIQKGEVISGEEIDYERGDGSRGCMAVSSAPIYSPEGEMVAAVMAFYDIPERRADRRRRQGMHMLVSALEDERRRISRNLHDQLGQQLTALKLRLESLFAESGYAAFREDIRKVQTLVEAIDRDLDFMAWELRPMALDDLGLPAALANFVQEWETHSRVRTEFHDSGIGNPRLLPEVETMLYRIAQEALNNVVKHAQASRVEVMLERRANQVILIVEDDGIGFDSNQESDGGPRAGLGLLGMRERAALVGGQFEIESAPGKGTTVYVRAPFQTVGEEK